MAIRSPSSKWWRHCWSATYNTFNLNTTISHMTLTTSHPNLSIPRKANPTMESCCTCATILSSTPPYTVDKKIPEDRRVGCCSRVICGKCIHSNNRFAEYCPFCQVSSGPSLLPQGLKEPPSYTSLPPSNTKTKEIGTTDGLPPPYTQNAPRKEPIDDEKAALAAEAAQDTLHFLNHNHDSIASLSLRYNVPANALRRTNNLTSDHLLLGRKTILIPGEFYKGGVSLSPRPVEGEEEELRKGKIRRFMTGAKVSDYDVALLYLEQAGYDIDVAMEAYFADEKWERENVGKRPAMGKKVDKGKKRGLFGRAL